MSLDSIKSLVADDLTLVDRVIRERLTSDVVLVNQVAEYIIAGGGKRLRPLVVVVAARACGHAAKRHTEAAAIIELIHTATLLHDDVVDASDLRRGRDTANSVWGNEASVLVGDYLYSRAFEMMVSIGEMRIMDIMASATNKIAEGEVLQLMNANDPDTTEQRYFDVIYRKTAKLFEAGCAVAGVLAGVNATQQDALLRYGKHLGTAFQLVDDALDYSSTAAELGKNLGDDLAEGKPTLPLIHALKSGTPEQQAMIRSAIENGGIEHLQAITAAIESTGGLQYTARRARQEADLAKAALAAIKDSPYQRALSELADFAVARTH
ncbi:MAG TPA: octaprenyl diphosphate synthase [Steroidobacteraceae bacterium]|nr:octaprenyl diphosphate synthase [Steroidobacteraceae bacterium]